MLKDFKLIDSHAHVNFEAFKEDRLEVIAEALEKKVGMINVGAAFETSRKAVEIAQNYSRGVWAAIGVHPLHVMEEDYSEECMRDLAMNNEKVVAVGETGLDYFHLDKKRGKLKNSGSAKRIKEKQKKVFLEHLKLARFLQLPVILHCRHAKDLDAHFDMLKVLENFARRYQDFNLRGTMHCYGGDLSFARIYLKLGLYLGFTGMVTFSHDYDEVIYETPLERILIETDCPYLSPEPKRGERNVPQNVEFVARKIAEIKKEKFSRVARQTTQNAINLFELDKK